VSTTTTSPCNDCKVGKNGTNDCAEVVSSNGHTTWFTPMPRIGDWDDITNDDLEGIRSPESLQECNGFASISDD
jgi:hypothetical protein